MRYKVGDRVRIVSERTKSMNPSGDMDKYLGTVKTIKRTMRTRYDMVGDKGKWLWDDSMIAGLASETPFDFDAWKDKNVCMRCRSREEARDFRCEMDKAGLRWANGDSYLDKSCFNHYEDLTCYYFNEGAYDSAEYAKNRGDQILEWSKYRSTEPPKEEQEKTMKTKIDDKPLSFTEAMEIRKRLCLNMGDVCGNCPLSLNNNGMTLHCDDFMMDHPDMAEPILKEWATEHPVKTNRDKFAEVFGKCEFVICSVVPCSKCDWWDQEYIEPFEGKVE